MELEQLWLDDGTPPGNPPSDNAGETPPATPPPTEPPTEPKFTKAEILRDLSKDLGFNVFEAEGLQQVKALIDSQKSEQEKMQEKLTAYEQREAELQAKLKATELGIAKDSIEDALKLADGNPDNLEQVVKKYPHFRSQNGITIGMGNGETPPPTGNTEAEEYLARNYSSPKYAKYIPQTKK
jgi:hypothetical protein